MFSIRCYLSHPKQCSESQLNQNPKLRRPPQEVSCSACAWVPGSALREGPAVCQAGGWARTRPRLLRNLPALPREVLGPLARSPLLVHPCSAHHGVRDQAVRALHVLLLLRSRCRQEDPDQACDGHRRRADGGGHRAGERVARPGCRGSRWKPAEKAQHAPLSQVQSFWSDSSVHAAPGPEKAR